jgi:O-antigen ligase
VPEGRRDWLQPVALGLLGLALALSPEYVVRYQVFGIPTTLLELALLVGIGAGLLALRGRLPWHSPYALPALALVLAATIEVPFSPDRLKAAGIWKAYFVEPALASLVIAGLVTTAGRARVLLAGLGVAGVTVALANLAAVVSAVAHGTLNTVTPPVAIYMTANAVPLYLVPLDAVALALLLYDTWRWERVLAGAFLAITGAAVLLSYSRSGWGALIAAVIVVAAFHRRRWRLAAAGAVLFAALLLVIPRAIGRIAVEFDFSSPYNTVNLRLALWKSAVYMLIHRPLFGGGLSGFRTSVGPYADPAYHENLIYPHNLVLNFWSETGLLGLAAFIWVLVTMFRLSRQALGAGGWQRAYSIGIFGVLAAVLVHGLTDVPYFKNDQSLAFWALLGIQAGLFLRSRERADNR